MRHRTRAAIAALPLALALLTAGCDIQSFDDKCKEAGGTVEKDRESCTRSVTKTTTVKGKTKTSTEKKAGYRTEKECIKDGKEIDESEGSCS